MPRSELVQSLSRATDMLDLAAQSENGLALCEICDVLRLKRTTVYNLVRTLVAKGLLEKSDRPVRYRLGPSIFRLADAHKQHSLVRRAGHILPKTLRQIMDMFESSDVAGQRITVSFGQILVGEVTMTLRVSSARPNALEHPYYPFGTYDSAVALVFQAYQSPKEQAQFRQRHPFAAEGASDWESQEKLEQYLSQVRELGYAAPPLYSRDTVRVAAPVFGAGNQLKGALGVGIWAKTSAKQRRELLKYLTESAKAISQQLPEESVEVN